MVSPGSSQYASAERRLQDLGIVLPNALHRLGAYVESVQSGSLLFLCGILPVKDEKLQFAGRLGKELDESAGRDALRTATLSSFRCEGARRVAGPRDEGCRREGLPSNTRRLYNQPIVADAASELLRDVFGKDKMSVRSVLGLAALPLGASVMLEVTLEVDN
jgi:hypothetical protein